MEVLNCKIAALTESKKFEVDFDGDTTITIDLTGDVDFTALVEKLAELFPRANEIVHSIQHSDDIDKKEALVLETIVKFIEKFNLVQNSSRSDYDDDEDDVPF